jgi:hypothetical protein
METQALVDALSFIITYVEASNSARKEGAALEYDDDELEATFMVHYYSTVS